MSNLSAAMAALQYTSLDRSTQSIRLFSLLSDSLNSNACIYGNLETFELASAPSYIALSYTWGDSAQTRNIWVNGQPLLVRENLYLALEALTQQLATPYSSAIAYLWIDFICINQGDVHERSHQVGLMSQIFGGASRTIAWLGPPADDSSYAMSLLDSKYRMDLETVKSWRCDTERFVKAILHLTERPYWRRVWIVQEFILPHQLTIQCGLHIISEEKWSQALQTINQLRLNGQTAHTLFNQELIMLCVARRTWHLGDTYLFKLDNLIWQFHRAECSDLRDRVFALLSLTRQKPSENFLVSDYTLSPSQLYYRALSCMRISPCRDDSDEWECFRTVLASALQVVGHVCDETVVYGACVAMKMRLSPYVDAKVTWSEHVLDMLIEFHRRVCAQISKAPSNKLLPQRVRNRYHRPTTEKPLYRHPHQPYQQVSIHHGNLSDFRDRVVNLHKDLIQEEDLDRLMIGDFSDSVWHALNTAIDAKDNEKINQLQDAVEEEEWWRAYLAAFPWKEVGSSDRRAFLREALDRGEGEFRLATELLSRRDTNANLYLELLLNMGLT